jgi:hypothetical protein
LEVGDESSDWILGAAGDDARFAEDGKPRTSRLPATCEVVMSPGMRITATTSVGTIVITAVDEVTRSYTWDGATRALEMEPQAARHFGSLGLFHVAQVEHWRDHHGITRGDAEEGHRYFKTVEEAMRWIKDRDEMPFVCRDDGLTVCWEKDLGGKILRVRVWQIFINGKKPKVMPGSQNDKIVVETVETETVPLVKAVGSGNLAAVKSLLAKGADANVRNSVGVPVIVMAIRQGSAPLVDDLLRHKADANVRDVDTDYTPIMEALTRVDIAKLLLDGGADVNSSVRKEDDLLKGMTPLIIMSMGAENEEIVRLLLDKGADVNARAPDGSTALAWAKRAGPDNVKRRAVIRMLLAAGGKE